MIRPGSTSRALRRLRVRLTVAFLVVASVGMSGLLVAIVLISSAADDTRLSDRLLASASRAAALVYVDGQDRVRVDAVRDDAVSQGPGSLVVVAFDDRGRARALLDQSGGGASAVEDVARRALADDAQQGTTSTVSTSDDTLRLAGMPWYDGDRIAGAVVAAAPTVTPVGSPLLPAVALGGAALLIVLTASVWLLAGRSLAPAAQIMEDREQFLATAAHELRAPLARLRAGAEAARREAGPAGPATRQLRQLVGVADSAGQMVSNLLLATRLDHTDVPVRREMVRLDELLIALELTVDDLVVDVREPVTVTGDTGLLRHALVNLVDNAQRHGRVGEATATVTARTAVEDGCPVLAIHDDGPGFPPDIDVLDRYASGGHGGTGLGLSLVRWIAEQHGARLLLSSGPPEAPGARVLLRFPAPRDDELIGA